MATPRGGVPQGGGHSRGGCRRLGREARAFGTDRGWRQERLIAAGRGLIWSLEGDEFVPSAVLLTPREVAELSGTRKRLVEKAIEERVLTVRSLPGHAAGRRVLPAHSVAYAVLINRLELRLSPTHKKRLARQLARLPVHDVHKARLELAPAVEVDVGRLVGDVMDRVAEYGAARDAWIVEDASIKGGTPVIRGTRMTVHSVAGRIAHGDTVDDVLADNPDLPRAAIEAAVTYARTHPLLGRPNGRPWARS